MHGEIIWRVEFFVLIAVHQYGDGAVVFGARQAARVVLTGEQAALAVAEVAVAVVRRAAENADLAGVLQPTEHSIVGDVAEKKIAAIGKPDRTFRPARAGVQAFDRGVANFVFCEARINDFDGGIGIEDGIFLCLLGGTRKWMKRQCRRGADGKVHERTSLHRSHSGGRIHRDAQYHGLLCRGTTDCEKSGSRRRGAPVP